MATIGLAAVLLAVATLIATLGAVTVTRHRAASAADLAALAGADHALEGQAQACGEAAKVARAQDTELVDCELDGEQVSVIVAAHLGSLGEARARATAGPVS